MARILPFKAIRAGKSVVQSFSVSAYDADVKAASFKLNKNNKNNFLHILSPQLYQEDSTREQCYHIAKEKVDELMGNGVLMEEDAPALYIYRQIKKNDVFNSIIGLADIDEYIHSQVKKHELTRAEKEDKMMNYFKAVGVNGNPVLLTFHSKPGLNVILTGLVEASPEYHFTGEDGTEHMVWVVKDAKAIEALQEQFKNVDALYIADGHHRCASFSRLYPEVKSFMACFIPTDQVRIHGFHRYLTDLNGMKRKEFLKELGKVFRVQELDKAPDIAEGVINLYINDVWYALHIPKELKINANPKHNLDVYILDEIIFGKILGIADSRTSTKIKYVNGETDLKALTFRVKAGDMKAAFVLSAVDVEDVIKVSDYNETMPPKSTWIEPKMRSGLLINKF